jgi:hypothetical protein
MSPMIPVTVSTAAPVPEPVVNDNFAIVVVL